MAGERREEKELTIMKVISPELKRLANTIVRTFYGGESFVVFDYIQRGVCIRDEDLRQLLKIEMKELRKYVAVLKNDTLMVERSFMEKGPDQKQRKVCYYSINYKSLLNVTRYKLCHMREKLDSRDRNRPREASYVCRECGKKYMDLELVDLFAKSGALDKLKCWLCEGMVEEDLVANQVETTWNSIAKFNEQMAPLHSMLKAFDKVQFHSDLLMPPLPVSHDGLHDEGATKPSRGTMLQGGTTAVTVTLGYEKERVVEKPEVPWLEAGGIRRMESANLPGQIGIPASVAGNSAQASTFESYSAGLSPPTTKRSRVEDELLLRQRGPNETDIDRLLQQEEKQIPKQIKSTEEGHTLVSQPAARRGTSNAEEEEEEEEYVHIGGKRVHIDDVTVELAAEMTNDEREAYTRKIERLY